MSREKRQSETVLWLGQAEDDLAAAKALAFAGKHAQSCFLCQQSGEKALKAATTLDKLYIPTRYPNGLPNMMPRDAYREKDSAEAIRAATQVLETATAICTV
jgi:HEPN domain-containing protein